MGAHLISAGEGRGLFGLCLVARFVGAYVVYLVAYGVQDAVVKHYSLIISSRSIIGPLFLKILRKPPFSLRLLPSSILIIILLLSPLIHRRRLLWIQIRVKDHRPGRISRH